MSQIATTIEQSKKLIGLGLSADTADMYWVNYENKTYLTSMDDEFDKRTDTYAWSLSALMELLSYSDTLYMVKAAKDDGYLWISLTQSLPNNPLIRDNHVYPSMIDMILEKYIYPSLQSK